MVSGIILIKEIVEVRVDGKVFPQAYDIVMAPLELLRFKKIRISLLRKAKGRVLEIGAGTGVNFPYYEKGVQVDAIDPNPLMMNQTGKRKKAAKVSIETHLAAAENLPFSDDSFDTVVATLVFCTIPEPAKGFRRLNV